MSFELAIEKHWDEITRKRQAIAECLSWSDTGRELARESEIFSSTPVMQAIMVALSDNNAAAKDQFKMAQYFAQALQGNPQKNIDIYITYLTDLINKTKETDIKNAHYFMKILGAVNGLKDNAAFVKYINAYSKFQNDQTAEAIVARQVMTIVTETMQKLMQGYL